MLPRILILIALAAVHLAAADPPWKKRLTPVVPGPFMPVPSGTIDLQVSWKGMIDAGKLRMEWAPPDAHKPGAYIVRSSAQSIGLAAMLFPYQNNFWAELDPTSLKPRLFHAVETDAEETKTTTSRFLDDHVEYKESAKSLTDGKVSDKNVEFKFAPVFEIFSAMLMVRSQKLNDGDQIVLVLQPFDSAHLLHVTVMGHEVHHDRKTIRLSVAMDHIARKSLTLKPYKKLKGDATLWLSDDDDRIPVELRAAVFIGDVRATLTNYQPTKENGNH